MSLNGRFTELTADQRRELHEVFEATEPLEIRRRVKALKRILAKGMQIEKQFYDEISALERKYESQFHPLYIQRLEIISGNYEPKPEECHFPEESDAAYELLRRERTEKESEGDQADTVGIPQFWLTAMKNIGVLAEMIESHDEPALQYLQNITVELMDEPTIDKDQSGYINCAELKDALDQVGFKIPAWEVRRLIEEFDSDDPAHRSQLSLQEFEKLCCSLKMRDVATTFKKVVTKKENLQTIGGMSEASSEGTTHSVRFEEQLAFSHWINDHLGHDPDLKHLLPIDPEGKTLYEKVKDGILLCKIINHSCPDTIDERAINKKNLTLYTKHENLILALNSAQAIGCNIINIDGNDLILGKPHLVLGLLWQIIRIGLFSQINLEHCPGLANLLTDGEKIEDLLRLPPEAILLRWVNYHLDRAGVARRCANFSGDINDSEIYSHLLYQIAPKEAGVTKEALMEKDLHSRAEMMLQEAEKLGCRSFVTADDVVKGVNKLNLAFVANLFNSHPGLDKPDGVDIDQFLENIEETREEKTYRNWMNSMGVSPHVHWLYSDLADGLVIFQLYDVIKPGIVDWNRVHRKFSKLRKFMEKLENCNYAVELGRQIKFSLVGIAGQDISDGNPTLTLALIWQLMRAYTLSVLTQLANSGNPIVEREIIDWVNNKLASAGKTTSIRNFQDSSIANARVVIDLIDAIKPGVINYEVVNENGSEEENLANAKYAVSMARKVGARVYALPEDIAEMKSKMVMTVFACLMARDYIPNMDSKTTPTGGNV